MWPDRISNPGPMTYESGALPTALCGPACGQEPLYTLAKTIYNYSKWEEAYACPSQCHHLNASNSK